MDSSRPPFGQQGIEQGSPASPAQQPLTPIKYGGAQPVPLAGFISQNLGAPQHETRVTGLLKQQDIGEERIDDPTRRQLSANMASTFAEAKLAPKTGSDIILPSELKRNVRTLTPIPNAPRPANLSISVQPAPGAMTSAPASASDAPPSSQLILPTPIPSPAASRPTTPSPNTIICPAGFSASAASSSSMLSPPVSSGVQPQQPVPYGAPSASQPMNYQQPSQQIGEQPSRPMGEQATQPITGAAPPPQMQSYPSSTAPMPAAPAPAPYAPYAPSAMPGPGPASVPPSSAPCGSTMPASYPYQPAPAMGGYSAPTAAGPGYPSIASAPPASPPPSQSFGPSGSPQAQQAPQANQPRQPITTLPVPPIPSSASTSIGQTYPSYLTNGVAAAGVGAGGYQTYGSSPSPYQPQNAPHLYGQQPAQPAQYAMYAQPQPYGMPAGAVYYPMGGYPAQPMYGYQPMPMGQPMMYAQQGVQYPQYQAGAGGYPQAGYGGYRQ